MMRFGIPIILLMSAAATILPAQEPVREVSAGDRVRVTVATDPQSSRGGRQSSADQFVGRLVTMSDSVLVIEGDGAPHARQHVRRAEVHRIERSDGPSSRSATARKGAIVGMLAGGVLGYVTGEDCEAGSFICFDRKDTAVMGAVVFGAVGGLIGLAAGGRERWREASLPARVSLRPRGRHSVGLSASIAF